MKFGSKQEVRDSVWKIFEESGISRFPPPRGRIPNFKGAEKACMNLLKLGEFKRAKSVFSAPDFVLRKARELTLLHRKYLIAAKPHLRGFLLLRGVDPKKASTITGMLKHGVEKSLEELKTIVPPITLFLQGCVAVDLQGNRIGKGSGYGDKEYHLLHNTGLLRDDCFVVVIAHDIQIFEDLSYLVTKKDVKVDWIITPAKIIKTRG